MKIELGSEITPQALNELDQEYQKITKKYSSLAEQSQVLSLLGTGLWFAESTGVKTGDGA